MQRYCLKCYRNLVPTKRWVANICTCMPCGEAIAQAELRRKASCVLPINKSTPTLITDRTLLRGLNSKRTI